MSVFDLSMQQEDVDAKIVAALERLGRAFRVLLWEEGKARSLSPIQIQFLVYLRFHDPGLCRVGHIARAFDLAPATVSDAVSTLRDKDLLTKAPAPDDGRARILRLTPEGRTLADALSGWAGVVKEHLAEHSDAEKAFVMRFLMDLIASMQEAGAIRVARMCLTCRFFGRDWHDDPEAPHHCRLLDTPLRLHELRIDCPEHEGIRFGFAEGGGSS